MLERVELETRFDAHAISTKLSVPVLSCRVRTSHLESRYDEMLDTINNKRQLGSAHADPRPEAVS